MKRLFIFPILLILLLPLLMGQQVYYSDNVSIAWDAVAPIEGSIITYEILRAPEGMPTTFDIVAEVSDLFCDVPMIAEGDFIIGVRTVRIITENGERLLSDINWSDVNGEWTLDPFIVRYFIAPEMPKNLRLQ